MAMAKRKGGKDQGSRAAKRPVRGGGAAPIHLTAGQQNEHRDAVAAEGIKAEPRQINQLAEMRLDMMRSVITEPLLSD